MGTGAARGELYSNNDHVIKWGHGDGIYPDNVQSLGNAVRDTGCSCYVIGVYGAKERVYGDRKLLICCGNSVVPCSILFHRSPPSHKCNHNIIQAHLVLGSTVRPCMWSGRFEPTSYCAETMML